MPDAPLKILVVDDEGPARRRLRELLDDCASALPLLVVGEAGSGREALGLLGTTPADLVLSDIHMPDMDEPIRRFASRLRSRARFRGR